MCVRGWAGGLLGAVGGNVAGLWEVLAKAYYLSYFILFYCRVQNAGEGRGEGGSMYHCGGGLFQGVSSFSGEW